MATKTKTSLMPKSKAKNAFDLLSEICALVLKEPRRLRMRSWTTDVSDIPEPDRPACGTVACIAGWVTRLKAPRFRYRGNFMHGDKAMRILGLDTFDGETLFLDADLVSQLAQGTQEHAEAAVAHIRRFQKEHAAQLKAKAV